MVEVRPIDLQRRLVEVGRIRCGEKGPKGEPRRLGTFRLTSRSRSLVERAARIWGGRPTEWRSPDGDQWQVVTETTELPVLVPASPSTVSRAYEAWSGAGLLRRCDGTSEFVSGGPCLCRDGEEMVCVPTTRVSLVLPDLGQVGAWVLVTRSWNALAELGGTEDVLAAARPGALLPGVVRLEQRARVARVDGKPQTRRFVVPVVTVDAVALTGELPGPSPAALSGPARPAIEEAPVEPTPEDPAGPDSTVEDPFPLRLGADPTVNAAAIRAAMVAVGLTGTQAQARWWRAWTRGGTPKLREVPAAWGPLIERALIAQRSGKLRYEVVDGKEVLFDTTFHFVVAAPEGEAVSTQGTLG